MSPDRTPVTPELLADLRAHPPTSHLSPMPAPGLVDLSDVKAPGLVDREHLYDPDPAAHGIHYMSGLEFLDAIKKIRETEPDMLFDLSPEEPADIEPPSPHDTMQSLRHYCEVNPRNPQTCSRGVEHCRVEHPPCSRCTELEAEVELLEARIDADGDAMAHEITRRAVLEALVRELYQTMEHSGCDLRLVARSRDML